MVHPLRAASWPRYLGSRDSQDCHRHLNLALIWSHWLDGRLPLRNVVAVIVAVVVFVVEIGSLVGSNHSAHEKFVLAVVLTCYPWPSVQQHDYMALRSVDAVELALDGAAADNYFAADYHVASELAVVFVVVISVAVLELDLEVAVD